MKNLRSTTLLAGVTALALTLAACSRNSRDEAADKTKDAYQDAKAAVANGWDNVKSYTYEKRTDFANEIKSQQAGFEANLSQLKANYSEAQASASRKAAMAELKDSEADFKSKVDALGNASADTWSAARDNVVAAWDKLQASYAKARAAN